MSNSTLALKPAEDTYGKDNAYIETVTGTKFWYAKPVFELGEMAHALSNICRYSGQCRRFFSVAEHSVLVSRIMEDQRLGDPLEGLLHDGVEAYLADIPAPAKAILKDYKALDKALDKTLRAQFKLAPEKSEGCTTADWLALAIEAKELMPSKGKAWAWAEGIQEQAAQLPYLLAYWTPEAGRDKFLYRYQDIRRPIHGRR